MWFTLCIIDCCAMNFYVKSSTKCYLPLFRQCSFEGFTKWCLQIDSMPDIVYVAMTSAGRRII